jgi:hypothetical protein
MNWKDIIIRQQQYPLFKFETRNFSSSAGYHWQQQDQQELEQQE